MPHGAEFAPDGHLWVGLEGYGSLVEMDTNGTILGSHTIPYVDTQGYSDLVDNHGLEVSRDGKVWFTGKESNVVGYYDPSTDQYRIFPLDMPDPTEYPDGNFPIYLDEAPDGSMYFTNLETSSVGRLYPDTGQITTYELPAAFGTPGNARPIRVVLRDDGVATVSEESGSAYAFITPDGVVTEHPLSPSDAQGASLTYDRAGQLWVQYNTPDAIARVNPDGSVTPFTIPTLDATQHRVTVGPDGALWFTELATDKIGRMVTGHENGPPVDRVLDQQFRAARGGVDYQAAFQQNRATFRARTRQMLQGRGNEADRQLALSRFRWNLQGAINQFATDRGAGDLRREAAEDREPDHPVSVPGPRREHRVHPGRADRRRPLFPVVLDAGPARPVVGLGLFEPLQRDGPLPGRAEGVEQQRVTREVAAKVFDPCRDRDRHGFRRGNLVAPRTPSEPPWFVLRASIRLTAASASHLDPVFCRYQAFVPRHWPGGR